MDSAVEMAEVAKAVGWVAAKVVAARAVGLEEAVGSGVARVVAAKVAVVMVAAIAVAATMAEVMVETEGTEGKALPAAPPVGNSVVRTGAAMGA